MWPLYRPGGAISPNPSGTYHGTATPSQGFPGLKRALASIPPGGSLLLTPGDYAYGPSDLERHDRPGRWEGDAEGQLAALSLSATELPAALFGEGAASLKPGGGAYPPPSLREWVEGGAERVWVSAILLKGCRRDGGSRNGGAIATAPGSGNFNDGAVAVAIGGGGSGSGPTQGRRDPPGRIYLTGLSLFAPPGTLASEWPIALSVEGGDPVIQGCVMTSPSHCDGYAASALGLQARPRFLACAFSGGLFGVAFGGGAGGRMADCEVDGSRDAGVWVWGQRTCPAVEGCRFGLAARHDHHDRGHGHAALADPEKGGLGVGAAGPLQSLRAMLAAVELERDAGEAWEIGEGNEAAEGVELVKDRRAEPEASDDDGDDDFDDGDGGEDEEDEEIEGIVN